MRSHFCHIQVQFSTLLFRADKLLDNCLTNVQGTTSGSQAVRPSHAFCRERTSDTAGLQHGLLLRSIILPPFIASTYQLGAFGYLSEAAEDPCLFLFCYARWLCTEPKSCCCCWMCCCSPHRHAFL